MGQSKELNQNQTNQSLCDLGISSISLGFNTLIYEIRGRLNSKILYNFRIPIKKTFKRIL
jgi:hypothetical protein